MSKKPDKREPRDSKVPIKKLLIPFDVTKFGSEDDPCFGKLYDLSALECQECGDIELCAIAFAQGQHIARAKAEGEARFKDLEEEEIIFKGKVRTYLKKCEEKGMSKTVRVIKAAEKFKKDKTYIKTLL